MPRTCPDCDWVWPKPTGPCPNCGSDAAPERRAVTLESGDVVEGEVPARMPWSLIVLAVAFAIYLIWRIVQMIGWVV